MAKGKKSYSAASASDAPGAIRIGAEQVQVTLCMDNSI